ncbi:MAG: DUF4055 domain-containing protein [Proteobacteria bacterium]|nr:DUF4055 domain-containing protein [Pseudomonadota bacterium]
MANKKSTSICHPLYDARLGDWKFLRDHYEGGRHFATKGYLQRHPSESDDGFKSRKDRAIDYRNFPEMVISIYITHLWQKEPSRAGFPKPIQDLFTNVDNRGTDADTFFKRTATDSMVEGISFVLVDMPRIPQGARVLTKADEMSLNLRPYLVPYGPQQVVDWSIETKDPARMGKFNWVVLKEDLLIPEGGEDVPFTKRKEATQFKVIYRDRWEVWVNDAEGNPVKTEEGPHGFGEVPLVPFFNVKRGDMDGASAIKDIAPLASKLFNKLSLLDEAEYWAGIPVLFIFSKAVVTKLGLGQVRAVGLDPEDRAEYLQQSADAIEAIRRSCNGLVQHILRLALKQVSEQKETSQVESADKKKMDREEFVGTLADKAANFEDAENRVWAFVAKGLKQTLPENAMATYNRKFEADRIAEQLEEAVSVQALSLPSKSFHLEFYKRLTAAILSDAKPDDLAKIAKELEAWSAENQDDAMASSADRIYKEVRAKLDAETPGSEPPAVQPPAAK